MAVIATGFFDGVHPGHRLVIETLLSEAGARGEQSLVVTFWPHPRAVLQSGADSLRYLTSRAERIDMLRALGVDGVETIPFTREFASLSAAQYLKMLCRDFQCSALVLGYDTRFGAEQAGPEEIAALAAGMGLDAVIAPPVCVDGAPVSST
ncbi:MAG: FAD synthetase family protein, partial [Bacteroidales bacterium]|nr:FAD synthetase family protein [Bacteroidales bacterium]